jgi:hypothetical protein
LLSQIKNAKRAPVSPKNQQCVSMIPLALTPTLLEYSAPVPIVGQAQTP